jgi:hypothetical protein
VQSVDNLPVIVGVGELCEQVPDNLGAASSVVELGLSLPEPVPTELKDVTAATYVVIANAGVAAILMSSMLRQAL